MKSATHFKRALLIGPMIKSTRGLHLLLARAGVRLGARGTCVIAVDRGLDWALRAGIPVDLAVGDWDSLRNRTALKRTPHLTLPRDKDRSDLYYALGAAENFQVNQVICIGFSGGLPDHQLAVLFDLASVGGMGQKFSGHSPSLQLVGPEADWFIVSRSTRTWTGRYKKYQRLSVFALGGDADGVKSEGLLYPLRSEILPPSSRGLSNRVTGTRCSVRVRTGTVLIVVPREA
ncbi:MAG: thiamine diphosphokinase [Bdellovibrionales bacterium GWC1_52_8]|nr:MAG: thiamine diphosphokinase [Bdellovibrionales bacterium GWA1_52_35]OFZ33098.1 MAG: thiamine diphosphokinase [Bdellovibrionales bacterium GWC1_52_8]